jgi:hypothetical protein
MAFAEESMYPAVHKQSLTLVFAVVVVVEFAGQAVHV